MTKSAALVGAQFGSEGKGVVAYELRNKYNTWVRTGGPNAGHSFCHEGKLWKMQALPCGWANPQANLIIGAGAMVSVEVINREVKAIEDAGYELKGRIFIDKRATIITPEHTAKEGHTKGEIHARIGSTGEGVGAARQSRLNRGSEPHRTAAEARDDMTPSVTVCDTLPLLSGRDRTIMLEGTQGFGLSLVHGQWPYVTSADTNAAQMCADAGVPPVLDDTILVARTYPIRVGGNSGPLKGETDWEAMSKRLGEPTEERTTVTKKVRRIGTWDEELFARAVMVNAPTEIVITFMDYLDPACKGITSWDKLPEKSKSFIEYIQRTYNTPVLMVGTGFDPVKGWSYAHS